MVNRVGEIEAKFKNVKNNINEDTLGQRFHCRLARHETKDQLENVSPINLETCCDQEFAEANAACLYDVNRFPHRW